MQINANGVVTFLGPSTFPPESFPSGAPSVAAFWTDVDQESTSDSGNVYYRVTDNNLHTLNFTNRVRESFRGSSQEFYGFTASQLLIVTWERVKGVGTNKVCNCVCV